MVEFDEYVDTFNSYYDGLVTQYLLRMQDERLSIDGYQTFSISLRGDTYSKHRSAFIYKYKKPVEENGTSKHRKTTASTETRFIISCGKNDVSINVKDTGYGGIEIRNTVYDRPYGDTLLTLGFCDDSYVVTRLRENRDKLAFNSDISVAQVKISAEDWSVERVLREMVRAVRIAWNNDEWLRDSEIIFNIIKPALTLAIMDEKNKWVEYLRHWEENYQTRLNSDNLKEEDIKRLTAICNSYNNAINILESKNIEELSKGKQK
jgi:hypothetical protein